MLETIRKSYYRTLATRCILAILLWAVVTGFILYVSLSGKPGTSYAESYSMMSALRKELFHTSVAIYVATSLFIALGIAAISLLYSFRVAGPAYRLGAFARKIAAGDLGGTVGLRRHDVIHMMADDLNDLTSEYKKIVAQVANMTKELGEIAAALDGLKGDAARDALAKLSGKRDEISKVLSTVKS
jgi:methyl-accepting chemotaxis protein